MRASHAHLPASRSKETNMSESTFSADLTDDDADREWISTGIPGLDEILRGGLPKDFVYLIQGDPGAGKTTLAMQFLLAGDRNGEKGLYLTLSESAREIRSVASSHRWDVSRLDIYEQLVGEDLLRHERETTMFHPAEVELGKTIDALLKEVDRVQPQRVVLDSLSEIRLLSQSTFRYRRQILALKEFFSSRKMTVLLLDDRTESSNDLQLHSVPHGVILLERRAPLYGAARRRLEVVKLRGVGYRGGFHDFSIVQGGLVVYPRLIAAERRRDYIEPGIPTPRAMEVERREEQDLGSISSDVPEIDALLGGGIDRGSSTIILGPAGAGKSSLAAQYATAAARHGEVAAMFIFDESRKSLVSRSESIGIGLKEQIDAGRLTAQQIDPAELPPGEFAHLVRLAVEKDGAKMIVIDSLNGYLNAMPEERFLTLHLHELLSYLSERGVATILVVAQHGLIGTMSSAIDVSYLADAVLLLRYYETSGRILKAVSVLKRRSGAHETAIRDFRLTGEGIRIGPPLEQFRGIMSGVPILNDEPGSTRAGRD